MQSFWLKGKEIFMDENAQEIHDILSIMEISAKLSELKIISVKLGNRISIEIYDPIKEDMELAEDNIFDSFIVDLVLYKNKFRHANIWVNGFTGLKLKDLNVVIEKVQKICATL